jgi:ectoine hydroxylase-related dioxygenase (phytanoyl-CoA dioxygenase family)
MAKAVMTEEQRLQFETNGYLVIPNALSPEELKRAREAADRAEATWRADTSRLGVRRDNLQQVQAIIEYDDVFLDLMEHPKVFPIVWEILGDSIQMIDNDYFISPPHTTTHADWHHDVGMGGVYHPRSTLMVKAFFLLDDAAENGGCTLYLPGSHRYPMDFRLPKVQDPKEMPCHVKMAYPAGTAYIFHCRLYHAASNNESDRYRRVLIYNYGHFWMKMWQGYEPSEALKAKAKTRVRKQLLGIGDAYGTSLAGVSDTLQE